MQRMLNRNLHIRANSINSYFAYSSMFKRELGLWRNGRRCGLKIRPHLHKLQKTQQNQQVKFINHFVLYLHMSYTLFVV